MKDLRGVVVDIQEEKGTVIVLTPEGDVREVITNGQQFQIGDNILFYEKVVEPPKEVRWRRRAIRYATATAAAVLLLSVSPIQISDLHLGNLVKPRNVSLGGLAKNVAYADSNVYIESKSNVKVGLKDQKVVYANALNQPAKKVLKEMRWGRNENIAEFIQTYFEEAKESGYLNPEDPVVISVDTAPSLESEKDDLLKKLESISKKHHIKVVAVAVPDEVVKKAEALGVTPGKLVISLVAKVQTGQIIPIDELKTVTVAELINIVPNVVNALPRFTEAQLEQLVRNISVVSAPANNQPTEAAKTENPPVYSETGTTLASNANTDTTTDVSNDNQTTDMTATDSTSNQSESMDSTGGSSSSEQSQEQPESQPQEETGSTTVNNEQQPEPQTKEEGQTQDEQTQTSQPQDDQAQESQPQEGQNQEEQVPGQGQENQQQQDQPQQDDQTQNDQKQQDSQTQDQQPTNGDESDKQPEDTVNSPAAAILEWVRNVLVRG